MIVAADWQPYAVMVGLLLITFSLVMNLRKRARAAAAGRRDLGRARRPAADEEKPVRRSMEQLLVELQGISRQINAQLDTKMRALTQLTDEARREIERLERLLEEARAGPSRASAPGPTAAALDPRHRRVYELADAGLTAVQIARQTGQPVGEVELILSLRSAGAADQSDRTEPDFRGGQIDLRT